MSGTCGLWHWLQSSWSRSPLCSRIQRLEQRATHQYLFPYARSRWYLYRNWNFSNVLVKLLRLEIEVKQKRQIEHFQLVRKVTVEGTDRRSPRRSYNLSCTHKTNDGDEGMIVETCRMRTNSWQLGGAKIRSKVRSQATRWCSMKLWHDTENRCQEADPKDTHWSLSFYSGES